MLTRFLLPLFVVGLFSIGVDFVFAGTSENDVIPMQSSPCTIPLSGDWIITSDCSVSSSADVPRNVQIQNNSVLTIPNQVSLGIDFENYNLTVVSGSGVLIHSGGTIKQKELTQNAFDDCSNGWKVTGYNIPLEYEYTGDFITIVVEGQTRQFKQDFVDAIEIQGWGETLAGDYLGWYSNSYHLNDNAVDAQGNTLVIGIIAVDPSLIDPSSNLIIPTLPGPWDEMIFQSSDTGGGIQQKHIDVFTGEGNAAADESRRITGTDNTVCQ